MQEANLIEEPFCISSVEQDRKKRRFYHIFADGAEEPVLTVHEDILIRFRLLKGQCVTPEDAIRIEKANGVHVAYSLAISYLGTKPRTRKEIERYLTRKELAPEVISHVTERLERERLLNDGEYARQFAEQRLRNHLKGSRWIKQELLQRGITRSEAAEAVEGLDPRAEAAAALKAASKKWPTLKGEGREKRHRLMQFLSRRGYAGDAIKAAVAAVAAGAVDEEEGLWLDN